MSEIKCALFDSGLNFSIYIIILLNEKFRGIQNGMVRISYESQRLDPFSVTCDAIFKSYGAFCPWDHYVPTCSRGRKMKRRYESMLELLERRDS